MAAADYDRERAGSTSTSVRTPFFNTRNSTDIPSPLITTRRNGPRPNFLFRNQLSAERRRLIRGTSPKSQVSIRNNRRYSLAAALVCDYDG